jgi:hypothetical protein
LLFGDWYKRIVLEFDEDMDTWHPSNILLSWKKYKESLTSLESIKENSKTHYQITFNKKFIQQNERNEGTLWVVDLLGWRKVQLTPASQCPVFIQFRQTLGFVFAASLCRNSHASFLRSFRS